nr:transposase [Dolosigranulum pigrum]
MIHLHLSESRIREVAKTYLNHFKGFLHCDGYSGYNIPRLIQVHYLAHIRRKFMDTSHTKHTTSEAVNGVNFCNKLFKVEEMFKQKQLNGTQLLDYRRTHLKPLLDEFTEWLDHHQYLMKAKLGKAIIYACKMLPSLYLLLDHAGLSISNNSTERAMRIPALGRKNWLFSQSIKGAIANGYFLTVIQTVIANSLDLRKYLEFLIDKLANLPILNHESIEAYLPGHVSHKNSVNHFCQTYKQKPIPSDNQYIRIESAFSIRLNHGRLKLSGLYSVNYQKQPLNFITNHQYQNTNFLDISQKMS